MKRLIVAFVAVTALLAVGAGNVQARDQIRIVGSSTVYPFASYVSEEFGATTQYPTPVIESTGSGGGMKLFSEGLGMGTPDISNASRQMKLSEYERNMQNGVEKIHEVIIGYDGISLCENKANPGLNLSRKELTLAVAAKVPQNGELVKNPYDYWDEINSQLPHREILIYGPPTTSGTRDAFEEMIMEAATEEMSGYEEAYTSIRQDGPYVASGENDNLIVQRLDKNNDAMGIFGFSYLDNNRNKIQPVSIDGVKPTTQTISTGKYPVARSLFFYVKLDHLDKVSGMQEYVDLFLSEKMIGSRGYLKRQGLIPMPEKMREQEREEWKNRELLQKSDLK